MKKLIVLAAVVMAMEVAVSCKDSNSKTTEEETPIDTLAKDTLASAGDSVASLAVDSVDTQAK